MLRYLQALGHRVVPNIIPAPPHIPLTEEEAKNITDNIKKTSETADERKANIAVNMAFNVAMTAIGGVMFVIGEELLRRENNFEGQDYSRDVLARNQDLTILAAGCLVAEISLGCAQSWVNNKFFKASNVANTIKTGVRLMTPEQVGRALDICSQNGDLTEMMVPRLSRLGMIRDNKMELSYMIGAAIASASDVDEDQKYLLLAAGKVVSTFLLERVERFAAKYVGEAQYFTQEFLNDFSAEQQGEIKKALLEELQLHVGCKEDTKRALIGAAKTFAFLGTVHQSLIPEGESLRDAMLAKAGDFAIGSVSANVVMIFSQLLRDALKKDSRVAVEEVENGDEEKSSEDSEVPSSVFTFAQQDRIKENTPRQSEL